MKVKNLSHISFDEILDCFLLAFENYFVKMPSDKDYYQKRWSAAKVDFNFSYGMFDKGRLVGFIIHAIDHRDGLLTAFNTGTGVLPEYRGQRIVKSLYAYALKELRQNGIEKSSLEVITKNEKAIQAYKSIGFKVCKKFKCFAGAVTVENPELFDLKEIAWKNVDWKSLPNQQFYSWDFQKETILDRNYTFYQVLKDKEPESFFIFDPDNQYVAQFDLLNTENQGWNRLFSALKYVSSRIKVINVDERLSDKINYLNFIGLENSVDQFEMELNIT